MSDMIDVGPHLISRANQNDMGRAAPFLLNFWIYFNLIPNTFFLPILVGTFLLSKSVKRHPTLINVCITWIFSGIFSLLLFYAGRHEPSSPKPSLELCIAQTALLHGITPMWSVAILALVLHIYDMSSGKHRIKGYTMVFLLAAPYIAQVSFTIATLVVALQDPSRVNRQRRFFYCSIRRRHPVTQAMSIFTAIMCVFIIGFESEFVCRLNARHSCACDKVALALLLRRNWGRIRKAGVEIQLIVRILVFGIYIFFGMVVNLVSMVDDRSLAPDTYAATIGLVVLLVFGSQPDVLRAWCFWRKEERRKKEIVHVPSADETFDPSTTTGTIYLEVGVPPPVPPKFEV